MERSDLPTADPSRTPPHLHQARAGAWPLPAQCLPLTLTSAPAVHAPPAQRACYRASRRSQGNRRARPPLAALTGRPRGKRRGQGGGRARGAGA